MVPAAAIPSDPSPILVKKALRSKSVESFGVPFRVASGMYYLFSAPASGGLGRNERSMDSMEIRPVGSAERRLKDSMVMVPAGQRAAQSPQRMQRDSFLSMADPLMTPSSSALMSSSSTPSRSRTSSSCPVVVSSKEMRSRETSSRQYSGQTSTQPPHNMQDVASSALPSKTV